MAVEQPGASPPRWQVVGWDFTIVDAARGWPNVRFGPQSHHFLTMRRSLPVYPEKRTFSASTGIAKMCELRT
jgi:hypothetical protein